MASYFVGTCIYVYKKCYEVKQGSRLSYATIFTLDDICWLPKYNDSNIELIKL